jgi:hypothetical protein
MPQIGNTNLARVRALVVLATGNRIKGRLIRR